MQRSRMLRYNHLTTPSCKKRRKTAVAATSNAKDGTSSMTCRDQSVITGVAKTNSAAPPAARGANALRNMAYNENARISVNNDTVSCAPKCDTPVIEYTAASAT